MAQRRRTCSGKGRHPQQACWKHLERMCILLGNEVVLFSCLSFLSVTVSYMASPKFAWASVWPYLPSFIVPFPFYNLYPIWTKSPKSWENSVVYTVKNNRSRKWRFEVDVSCGSLSCVYGMCSLLDKQCFSVTVTFCHGPQACLWGLFRYIWIGELFKASSNSSLYQALGQVLHMHYLIL